MFIKVFVLKLRPTLKEVNFRIKLQVSLHRSNMSEYVLVRTFTHHCVSNKTSKNTSVALFYSEPNLIIFLLFNLLYTKRKLAKQGSSCAIVAPS